MMQFRRRMSVLVFFCLLSVNAMSLAQKPLLTVDFNSSTWSELMSVHGGKVKVANGAAILSPDATLESPSFPYQQGTRILVSVQARCTGVKPGNAGYKIGWATVTGYDAGNQGVNHHDILLIQGDQPWKTYSGEFTFSSQVRSFRVHLNHAGSAGTVLYKNLEIAIKDPAAEDLIGDFGFEGTLNADHWYFVKSGTDWDNFKTWVPPGEAMSDSKIKVNGKCALKLTDTFTVVSKAFPYHGEKLILSAWIRTDKVTKGNAPWGGGGIQFVGLGADGKHFCHHDPGPGILTGTNGWRFICGEYSFPVLVKNVQVWIRMFEGATGTTWFDDVRLQRVPLANVIPFDAQKASVTVDAGAVGPVINNRVWAGIDTGVTMGWWLRDDVRQIMPLLKKAGFELIRNHEIINGTAPYVRDDEKGNPVYDWTKFDSIHDLYVKNGMIPIETIETTPEALDKPGVPRPSYNNTGAPKDMVKWGKFIEDMFEHVVQRYGKAEAEKWFWEVWNEPGFPSGYYTGTREEFAEIAAQIYLAAGRVEKRHGIDLKIGLASGSNEANEVMLPRLQKLGLLNQVDHYSTHIYAGGSSSIRQFREWLDGMRDYQKRFPAMKKYMIGCTEWNCNSMPSPLFEVPWNASFAVKAVKIMLDAGLDYATYFGMVDHPEIPRPPALFLGDNMGMFTRFDIPVPKPVYNAFVFLNELKGGKRLGFASSNDPIDGIAVVMPDQSIRIVLTNYDEDISRQPYSTHTTITIQSPPGKAYRCVRLWAADDKYGNTQGKWVAMGKPPVTDTKAKLAIRKEIDNVQLDPTVVKVASVGSDLSFTLDVPSPGIRFVDIKSGQP